MRIKVSEIVHKLHKIHGAFEPILLGYGALVFAANPVPSLFVLAATFYRPYIGLLGLAGGIVATLSAMWIGGNKLVMKSGIYGVSGILVGLALGMNGEPGLRILVFTFLAAAFSGFVSVVIGNRFARRDLPILSVPLMIVIWPILITYGTYHPSADHFSTLRFFNSIDTYLFDSLPLGAFKVVNMFGSIIFQDSFVSSILVLIAVALYSRITLLYGLWGALIGSLFHVYIHGSLDSFQGLNYVLTAMALGGFFVVPNRHVLSLVTLGIAAAGIIDSSATTMLSMFRIGGEFSLPTLSLAFNLVTLILLYPLKSSHAQTLLKIRAVPLDVIRSPELNLRWAELTSANFQKTLLTFPTIGEWTIYQGNNGHLTHKGTGRYAWDFVIKDHSDSQYQGVGLQPNDYYAFNLPVIAPAGGTVIEVMNDLEDNPIGSSVTEQKWGNTVLIDHWNGEYSRLAHFKKGSILVYPGQLIQRGGMLGRCGNSGRSAIPHLHYQLQSSKDTNGVTLPAMFSEGVVDGNIVTNINPATDQRVSGIEVNEEASWTLLGKEGQEWRYRCMSGRWKFEETLVLTTDAFGYPIVASRDLVWYIIDRPTFIELVPDYKTVPSLFHRSAWVKLIGSSLLLPKKLSPGMVWEKGRVVTNDGAIWTVISDGREVKINALQAKILDISNDGTHGKVVARLR